MKKILIAVALILGAVGTMGAQGVSVRASANLGFSRYDTKTDGVSWDASKLLAGLRAGASVEIPLTSSGLYLAPGLNYMMKGAKYTGSIPIIGSFSSTERTHHLVLPVNIGFRAGFARDMSVFIEAGPYLGLGVAGDTYKNSEIGGITLKDGAQRFDAGIGVSAGYEYSRMFIQIGFEYGFVDMYRGAIPKSYVRNMDFFLGLGYRF